MSRGSETLKSASGTKGERVQGSTSGTLTDQVWSKLRQDILDGTLPPGERLSLESLKSRYNYGVSSFREALWRLSAEGLVVSQSHRGFEVSKVFREQLVDITRLRIMLEQTALTESIEAGDDDWEAEIVAAFHRLSKYEQADGDPWNRAHFAFHEALVSACSAPMLQQIRRQLFDLSSRYRKLAQLAGSRDDLSEHKALMEACMERDATEARALVKDHFNRTASLVLEKFDE